MKPFIPPLIVAEWPRNKQQVMRVALDTFNGVNTINIRTFYIDSHGEARPTRQGISLSVQHLPPLADALALALEAAKERGLIS